MKNSSTILIAYFSHEGEGYVNGSIVEMPVGNTRKAAQIIQLLTGADLYRIVPEKPYPANYMETVRIAQTEQQKQARPAIKEE